MTTKAWRIKGWDECFTCSQGKGIKRPSWVPFPIRLDGERYKMLMLRPGGPEAFGVFAALVEVAACCPTKGVLRDDTGQGLSESRLAVRASIPMDIVSRAIAVLSAPEIGWLIEDEADTNREPTTPPSKETIPANRKTLGASSEQTSKRSEQNHTLARARAPDQTRGDERDLNQRTLGAASKSLGDAHTSSGWLVGTSPREMLASLHIREPALGGLITAGVTAQQIRDAWSELQAATGIGSRPAVLIDRLERLVGIVRDKKPRAHVSSALLQANSRLHQAREQAKTREFDDRDMAETG